MHYRTELDGRVNSLKTGSLAKARLKEIEAEKEQVTAEIEEVKLQAKDVVVIENLRAAITPTQLQKAELKGRLT